MIYHCQSPPGASAGRTIATLLRTLKQLPSWDRCYFYGARHLTLSGKLSVILAKHRSRLKTINLWGRGPYRQKTPARFFKRMLRGMLNYKGAQKQVYKKIIVDPQGPKPPGCVVLPVKILQMRKDHTLDQITRLL